MLLEYNIRCREVNSDHSWLIASKQIGCNRINGNIFREEIGEPIGLVEEPLIATVPSPERACKMHLHPITLHLHQQPFGFLFCPLPPMLDVSWVEVFSYAVETFHIGLLSVPVFPGLIVAVVILLGFVNPADGLDGSKVPTDFDLGPRSEVKSERGFHFGISFG